MPITSSTPARPAPGPLPSPADRPGVDIVVYDGQCRFCTAQVRRLHRWDSGGRLSYLSLHDEEVARRFPDLKHDDLMRQMVVVDTAGRHHWGADAVRYLSRRLPRLWAIAPLLHIPFTMPLWRFLYRQVAERRYWFGRVETCDDGACALHR